VVSTKFSLGVVILAAGSSRRMGRTKLLLPWAATSVLGHLVQQWQQLSAAQIGIVCAPEAGEIQNELDRLDFPKENRIVNPAPERGMFSSIQCAASWPGWKTELSQWLITLGDQPHLLETTLQALLDFAAANTEKICQPLWNGKRRHPVLLPKRIFVQLAGSSASDLKQFLAGREADWAGIDSDDAGLDLDLDTPADYEHMRKLYPESQLPAAGASW